MITVLFVRTDRLSYINIRVIITSIISGIISGFVYLKSHNEVTVVATTINCISCTIPLSRLHLL